MKFNVLGLALSLTAAFGLMACGDDSSSSASGGDKLPAKVGSIEEALKLDCNADLKCQKVFVEDIVQDYFYCDGTKMKEYTIMDEQICPATDDDIPKVDECKVTTEGDAAVVSIKAEGYTMKVTSTFADGKITEVSTIDCPDAEKAYKENCADEKAEHEGESVECDDSAKTITSIYADEDVQSAEQLKGMMDLMCDMMLNPEKFAEDLAKDLQDAVDKMGDDDATGDDAGADADDADAADDAE